MADKENPHFREIFWFCVGIVAIGFGYIFYVTVATIPDKNQRTVDTVVGFALGSMVMSAIGYLLGGNPAANKKSTSVIPENSETTITATTTTKTEDTDSEITTNT